jgi:hypothetical protein
MLVASLLGQVPTWAVLGLSTRDARAGDEAGVAPEGMTAAEPRERSSGS